MAEKHFEPVTPRRENPRLVELRRGLELLRGKTFVDFEIDEDLALVTIKFEGGRDMQVNSWDDYNDRPGFDNIKVMNND